MKYLKVFVVAILVISLIINIRLLVVMGDLENRVGWISNNQTQLMNSVSNQTGNINNIMNDFKREQSWISSIRMDVESENLEKGKATLNFEWQINELLNNSEVVLHYKYGESQEYSSVSAVEIENSLFEANIPIDVQLEPEWYISFSTQSRNNSVAEEVEKEIFEKELKKENDRNQLSYYVTVSNDDLVKSSEISTTHIGNLGTRYYGVLEAFVSIYDESYNVSVMGPTSFNGSDIFLEEVYLLKYQNRKLVDEEKLTSAEASEKPNMPTREHSTGFHTKPSEEKFEYTSLVVKAVFSNGISFEQEIYPK